MKRHTFLKLLSVLLVVLVGVISMQYLRAPKVDLAAGAQKLIPELEKNLASVNQVKFIQAGNATLLTLKRTEQGWIVPEQYNYPADVKKVREFLVKLSETSLLEEKTSKPEKYASLGLVGIDKSDATGVQVEIEGMKKTGKLIIGLYNGQGTGTFVRFPDQAKSWLAAGSLLVEKEPINWLAVDLFDFDSERVRAVEVERNGGLISIEKESPAQPNFSVTNVPANRTLSSDFIANSIATALTTFRAEKVLPIAQIEAPTSGSEVTARYHLFDGINLEIKGWQSNSNYWVKLSASLDKDRARMNALADSAFARLSAEKSTDRNAPAAKPTPVDLEKREQEVKQAIEKLNLEVDRINRLVYGWAYQIPPYKFMLFDKQMKDLLI